MPQTKVDLPKQLRAYRFHGLDLTIKGKQASSDCPFCGREGKFTISVETGLWRCYGCNEGAEKGKAIKGGNVQTFLERLWDLSDKATNDYEELLKDRKLLYPETLMAWGVCRSLVTKEWMVPGRDVQGRVRQLYRYVWNPRTKKRILMATPDLSHQLFGPDIEGIAKKPDLFICEGPWDGMALWEAMGYSKHSGGEFLLTANKGASLLRDSSVIAVPGCNSFNSSWSKLGAGKAVAILFDSDHPKQVGDKTLEPAGLTGMKRVAETCSGIASEVLYLNWGEEGYDPELASGFDVRDGLTESKEQEGRVHLLETLLTKKIAKVPDEWLGKFKGGAKSCKPGEIDCLPCSDWKTLVGAFRKALRWGEGLDRGLSVMLACVISTKAVGDQLWCKILGPPSCGKSVLCEALSTNKEYIIAKSTIRGFHSGFKTDREGVEDHSLAALVKDKTLVTKDGDALLQSPNLEQILSEARDIYDRTSRTHYRSGLSRSYEGLSMTWLLCGTESLRSLDDSELGERFLDCVLIEDIDEDEEDAIGWRVANRAKRELSFVSDGKMESRDGPDMTLAKRLTGGYVSHLRDNSQYLLDSVKASPEVLSRCQRMGKFVAYMRARPSKKQEEKVQRELSYRLISQTVRLATCLAAVLNRDELDEEVMRRTSRVIMDTSRGRTLEIVRRLYRAGQDGMDARIIALQTDQSEQKERTFLGFLRKIHAVESFQQDGRGRGLSSRTRWRLTSRMRKLFEEVMELIPGSTQLATLRR